MKHMFTAAALAALLATPALAAEPESCAEVHFSDVGWSDITETLRMALASGRAVGMEVTIYNPALDEDGRAGRELTNVLVAALGTSSPWAVIT